MKKQFVKLTKLISVMLVVMAVLCSCTTATEQAAVQTDSKDTNEVIVEPESEVVETEVVEPVTAETEVLETVTAETEMEETSEYAREFMSVFYRFDGEHQWSFVEFSVPEDFSGLEYELDAAECNWFADYAPEVMDDYSAIPTYISFECPNYDFDFAAGTARNYQTDAIYQLESIEHEYFTHHLRYEDEDGSYYEFYLKLGGTVEDGDYSCFGYSLHVMKEHIGTEHEAQVVKEYKEILDTIEISPRTDEEVDTYYEELYG